MRKSATGLLEMLSVLSAENSFAQQLHPMATYVEGRKVYEAPDANGAF